MELSEVTFSAFKDELEKIGGGFTRSGIRPYKADTLLKQTGRFVKKNFRVGGAKMKTSAAKPGFSGRQVGAAALTGGALAIYGQHKAKKALEDYQTGREIRKAQQGGM